MFYQQNVLQYILVIILAVLSFIYIFYKYSYSYWKRKGVTYLKPSILFGNAWPIARKQLSVGTYASSMYTEIKKINKYFGGYYIFHLPVIMPIDPNLIKTILVKDFQCFQDRGFFFNEYREPILANLVNLKGERWKNSRTKLNPTFTSGKIKMMFQTLLACSEELDNVLEIPSRTQEPIDINDILGRLTTDNITSCVFALECNSLRNPNIEYRKYSKMVMETTFEKAGLVGVSHYYPFVLSLLKISVLDKRVTAFYLDIIKQTIEYREQNNIHRNDFMDIYIQMKNNKILDNDVKNTKIEENITFNELAAAAFAFYVAGFETTQTSMTFGLYELSVNPDIQNKLREEILGVLKNYAGKITYDGIMEMPYMDKVVKEILRKYPPIPILNRECSQAYKIPGTDITIDKGTKCWISILGIHMDPEYYPDPHTFDPERFSEVETAKRHPFTYLPFGEGPRICIGKRFGLLQMKVGLTRLLKIYKFQIDPKTPVPVDLSPEGIFLRPNKKIWLRCTKA